MPKSGSLKSGKCQNLDSRTFIFQTEIFVSLDRFYIQQWNAENWVFEIWTQQNLDTTKSGHNEIWTQRNLDTTKSRFQTALSVQNPDDQC